MDPNDYEPRYLAGVKFFNECEFFESHEVWEELWADEEGSAKRFYQGLIQAAVALHHFGNGNIRGALKLNTGCRAYLNDYRPFYLGLDLDAFLTAMDACFAEAVAASETFPNVELIPDLIPEIHLDPPPVSYPEWSGRGGDE